MKTSEKLISEDNYLERLKNIDELRRRLDELRGVGSAVTGNFSAFGEMIAQEKFPDPELLNDINENFFKWLDSTAKFFNLYAQTVSSEMPLTFSDAEKFLDAEDKKIRESSIFLQAENFLHFTTKAVDLRKILREHQTKLRKLLAKKRQNEKWRAEVEPYAKFFRTTQETDLGKKFSASNELREFFSDDLLGRGLFGNELILQTEEKPVAVKTAIKTAAKAVAKKTVDAQPTDKKISKRQRKKKIAAEVPEIPPAPKDSFLQALTENGALLSTADFDNWEKIFNTEIKPRNKEFSANQFKRDFKNSEILKPVLCYVASRGILAPPVFAPKKMPRDFVENVAQLLLNKGYIRSFSFADGDNFYGLTRTFADFAKTENGKRFLNSKHGEKFDFDATPFYMETVDLALPRAIYLEMSRLERAQGNLPYDVDLFALSFLGEFVGENSRDLFIGGFWDGTNDYEKFSKRLTVRLNRGKKFTRVFVTGLSFVHAANVADALEKIFPNVFPKDAAQYLYGFDKKVFRNRANGEKISPEKIWRDDPEPDNDPESEKIPDSETSDVEAVPVVKRSAAKLDGKVRSEIFGDVKTLLAEEKFYCAAAYLKAKSLAQTEVEPLYRQMAFALDDPLLGEGYSATAVSLLACEDDTAFNESLITAAALRALFYNDFGIDYGMPVLQGLIGSFDLVRENSGLAELIGDLKKFKTNVRKGVDYYADYRTKDKIAAQKNLDAVIRAAEDYHTRFFGGLLSEKADNRTFIRMEKIIFEKNGDLGQIFNAIRDKREVTSADTLALVKDFLSETFLKRDASFDAVNIDADKLDDFIGDNWAKASDKKSPGKLKYELKSNITKNLERGVKIMCDWVNCVELFGTHEEDAGSIAYKKIRAKLLDNITSARQNLNTDDAGALVVDATLAELAARLEGNFNYRARRYFYADFLRGEKIVLDENYFPKFDLNVSDGTREHIPEQIKAHAALTLPTFAERIEEIFEDGGDDFGTAQLIDDYLREINGESTIERNGYDLRQCVNSAAKDAPRYRESFIGGLELAQSYGQFDTSPDGEKEKLLQLAENCYRYAEQSTNFGVFFRVKNFWESVLKKNTAERGKILKADLLKACESYKHVTENFDVAELDASVAEIEQIIDSGNFTVARSLIAKLNAGELYKKFDDGENDALSRFIGDYDDCYAKIYDNAYSLENLVGKIHTHDKISRAKANLVKSWITNPLGEDKIKTLLELLGFNVESVQKTFATANTINFGVKITAAAQSKYYHPIAAFGSDAEADGFRATCLFGKFDEKNLIAKFKELGDGNNTLILLDYALDLPTRRRLAKEIKLDKDLTKKVFAVVDRVTIMYLLRNCAEQIGTKRINDTLMALIMPFARYQPYISSPRIPLPPEMFIGRETEINEVMNQDGVNIVCGGRQLGKSALLKMACRKIDNHNGERAIYLEIIDKDYSEAALLTSRELSDKNFFAVPFETDDWEELARAIRNRLASDAPTKIPYFLLMLDEADRFIETCAEKKYSPIIALAKIQQESHNGSRFKFVIAGLRNIIRFERENIMSNNNILPTLKSRTIKPFGLEDARKLLEVPLRYLGLYFPDSNKDSMILSILETANYFPSLIQLYCEKLVKALFETSYADYNADTPIYTISENHIKKVLADKDFTDDIKTKIEITLGLGTDKYYHAIANLLAYLYYNRSNVEGYSSRDILNTAEEFDLIGKKILPDSEEKIGALMEELCELNILRKNGANYLFSRQRILRVVGTLVEVDDALLKLAEAAHE